MGKASSAKKIQRVQRAGVSKTPGQRRALGFPAAIIGILIVGSVLVFVARDARSSAAATAPEANKDHWHTAFGVYDCGEYLPPVPDSGNDPNGIHTHSDGLIHVHPFGAAASGNQAKFSVFADAVGIVIDDDTVTMPAAMGGQELKNGADCEVDGEKVPGELKMLIWPPQATDEVEPEVVDGDFGNVRFTEDGQIMVLALIPEGTDVEDIPLPSSIEALKDPLAAEGGGTQQPTESTVPQAIPGETVPATPDPASQTTAPAPETTAPGN